MDCLLDVAASFSSHSLYFSISPSLCSIYSSLSFFFSLSSLPSYQLFHTENARLSTCSIFLPCPEPLNKICFCCKSFIVFDSVWEILYALTFSFTCISVVAIVVLHCTCVFVFVFLFFFKHFSFFFYSFLFSTYTILYSFSFTLYSLCFFFAFYSHQPISHQLHFAAR